VINIGHDLFAEKKTYCEIITFKVVNTPHIVLNVFDYLHEYR